MYVPIHIAAVIVGLLALSGCSTFKIAYSFADNMVEDRAETYLDLSAEQRERLTQQATALIAWHRAEMLPKYASFFSAQADLATAGGWTRAQLATAIGRFRTLIEHTVKGASPLIAEVLAEHTNPQKLAHLEARMAKNLAERRAEEAAKTRQASIDQGVKRRVDWVYRFTGPLTDAQIDIIRGYTESGSGTAMRWFENREHRQNALVAFLRTRPKKTEIAEFVSRIILRAHEVVDPDYHAILAARWAVREAMYYDILATINDEQRRKLITNLRGYAADMIELSRTKSPAL